MKALLNYPGPTEKGKTMAECKVCGAWYSSSTPREICPTCERALRRLDGYAVPMDDMKEFAEDVVYQFGYYGQHNGRLHIGHGGLSTLEWAFDILGWDNPHPVPEFECEIDGCHEHATCGAPTSDGYKRMCGKHYAERGTNA